MSEAAQPSIEERLSAVLSQDPAPAVSEPEQAAQAQDAPVVDAAEAPDQEDLTSESSPDAPDPAAEASPEQADAESGDDDVETLEIGTLAELAEHLGVEVADLYENVTVPIYTEEGKREVTLGEWKDGWRANQEVTASQQELLEQRQAFESQQQQMTQQYHHQLAEAAGLADQLQAAMMAPYEGVDWARLREDDPVEWTSRRQEMLEAQARVQGMRQEVQQRIQAFQQQFMEQQTGQQQALLARERQALFSAVPELADPQRAPTEMAELRQYLQTAGFRDDEIANAYDHRLIIMARKARLYDESQKSANAAKKKVVKLARTKLKPGARQTKQEQQHDSRRAIRAKLKKSGHVDDAAAAIRNLL
jgi:hypothetical protein